MNTMSIKELKAAMSDMDSIICPLPGQLGMGGHHGDGKQCPHGIGCLEEWAAAAIDGEPTWGNELSPAARSFANHVLDEAGLDRGGSHAFAAFDHHVECGGLPVRQRIARAWRVVARKLGFDTRNQPRI